MNNKEFKTKIDNLKTPKILVVGDFAIDEMIFGQTSRISREAPVLILEHTKTKIILGTASNCAHNISSLNDGKVAVIGVYGDDYYGNILLDAFKSANIDPSFMVKDKSRATTTKTRISGSCSQSVTQQIVRVDRQSVKPLDSEIEAQIIKNMEAAIPKTDAVILSDYHLGVLTPNVIKSAVELCKKYNKIITCDAQKDLSNYKNVIAITPNQPDTEKYVGYFLDSEEKLYRAGKTLCEELNIDNVLITRGSSGMILFEKSGRITKIPAYNKTDVFDVTGAGDTVVAVFTLALAAGLEPPEAAIVGNLAASIVIRHFGCHVTCLDEIKEVSQKINCKVEP